LADILAEGNEKIVIGYPVFRGKFLIQGLFRFVGRLGTNIAPAIIDPVHVNIDTYARLRIADGHDKVCRFPTNSW